MLNNPRKRNIVDKDILFLPIVKKRLKYDETHTKVKDQTKVKTKYNKQETKVQTRSKSKLIRKELSSDEEESDDDFFDIEDEFKHIQDNDPSLYKKILEIKEELNRTEPKLKVLLKSSICIEDKAKLCQYYKIYKNHEPDTEECLEARDKYNNSFKEYTTAFQQSRNYSKQEIKVMKEDERQLTGFDKYLNLKYKILTLQTTKSNKEVIYRKYEELVAMEKTDDEYGKLKNWLYWVTEFPHDKIKEIRIDNKREFIVNAKQKLDSELYGMEKAKEQILLFINAKLHNPGIIQSNLALIGSPGVGKTRISRLISEIMDWGFAQISFGGASKGDFLKGHDYTYIGAQPGEIVKCLKKMGHKNGIIFLDEIDKISDNQEIFSALLHLIDPSQNFDYKDNFFGAEISIDLSKIWYIGSMNKPLTDEALMDRWYTVNIEGYTVNDKIQIIDKYLLPRAIKNHSNINKNISFNHEASKYLINKVCKRNDKGVRTIEKTIKDIVNKINFLLIYQDKDGKLPFKLSFELNYKIELPLIVTEDLLSKLLHENDIDTMLDMMYL